MLKRRILFAVCRFRLHWKQLILIIKNSADKLLIALNFLRDKELSKYSWSIKMDAATTCTPWVLKRQENEATVVLY
jgi:hypothetical protein